MITDMPRSVLTFLTLGALLAIQNADGAETIRVMILDGEVSGL
jgi:hypothetical protein